MKFSLAVLTKYVLIKEKSVAHKISQRVTKSCYNDRKRYEDLQTSTMGVPVIKSKQCSPEFVPPLRTFPPVCVDVSGCFVNCACHRVDRFANYNKIVA